MRKRTARSELAKLAARAFDTGVLGDGRISAPRRIIEQMAINQIKPNPRNAKTHPRKQIRQIADSIVEFGFNTPLAVTRDGELIAGHARYEAAKLLGLKNLPVIILTGLSPAKQRAYALADNKLTENGGWDRERLAIEIPALTGLLAAEGLDVSILGFEQPRSNSWRPISNQIPQTRRM